MSLLLPHGVTHLMDLPYNIFNAIRNALAFLGFDELDKDERPDPSIWLDDKSMKKHWKRVESIRKVKYGGKPDNISDVPIDGPVSRNALIDELYA